MDTLIDSIQNKIPIIDHHAHNLLTPSNHHVRPYLAITSEASGSALNSVFSSLAHIRAVKQLANILHCEPSWEVVKAHVEAKNEDQVGWARRCFRGIETVLIDDGLDDDVVHPLRWHDQLVRSRCKRILRIERVAEKLLSAYIKSDVNSAADSKSILAAVKKEFTIAITNATNDPDIAGFKSVICYRTGLAIRHVSDVDVCKAIESITQLQTPMDKIRHFQNDYLNPYFVHLTARIIEQSSTRKPFQFHTGLGYNDIVLSLSSPAHLQDFIKFYPSVPIVLLHASYPFIKEAGYLASTYENVYLDIGEVFPMVSQEGQEKVVREALELCPSEKLSWSTDGRWFPETFLLAVLQVKDAFQKVLCDYVQSDALSIAQATKIATDVFFNTSNKLYKLQLNLDSEPTIDPPKHISEKSPSSKENYDISLLMRLLSNEPSVKYISLRWLDFTSLMRLRIFPINEFITMIKEGVVVEVARAVLGLLQHDELVPGSGPVGFYNLYPKFDSLRLGARKGHATVQCEFQEKSGLEVATCPRTFLRTMIERCKDNGLEFLVGFEIEVVFMKSVVIGNVVDYLDPINQGHSWSGSRPFHDDNTMTLVLDIVERLKKSSISIQQFHAETAPSQFEFVLGPKTPLAAVDELLSAREIIFETAAKHSMRATLVPKPYTHKAGTGSHIHLSVTPSDIYPKFYAGVLKHLRAITAFTCSNITSFDRIVASSWAGGTFVSWGTQNRETALRRIKGSHFEIKCTDGFANMYLAVGAIIGAGLQGYLDSEELTIQDCPVDPATLSDKEREKLGITQKLPASVEEALDCLRQDSQFRQVLGFPIVDAYLAVKQAECSMLGAMDPEKRRNWLIARY